MVLRKRVTTAHFAAITIRSCSRLILLTAAAISGVTPGASATSSSALARVGQQPVAQAADGEMRDRGKGRRVVAVDDEPGHLVALVGDHVLGQERGERQVGERVLRGHALLARRRGDAGELVAAAQRRGLGHERLEIGKDVAARSDRRAIHAGSPLGRSGGSMFVFGV